MANENPLVVYRRTCLVCHRALRSEQSRRRGMGPRCYRRWREAVRRTATRQLSLIPEEEKHNA